MSDPVPGTPRTGVARFVGPVLTVIGVAILSALAWRRLLRGETPFVVVAAGVVVVLAAIALGFWIAVRRSQSRHRAVEAQRPGWRVYDVFADASLAQELMRAGLWERRLVGGSRLTLAWSQDGLELWRGTGRAARVVIAVPWPAVSSVTTGEGHAASSARPAAVVGLDVGATLVLVPARRALGGVLPADVRQVDALVTDLRRVRDAA